MPKSHSRPFDKSQQIQIATGTETFGQIACGVCPNDSAPPDDGVTKAALVSPLLLLRTQRHSRRNSAGASIAHLPPMHWICYCRRNQLVNLNRDETIWRRERLHKGIFVLPALVFAVPLIPMVAFWFLVSTIQQKTNEAFQPMPAQANPSGLFYLPLIAMAVPWLMVCLASLVSTLLAYLKSEITLTNRRLLFHTGFIMRVSGELPLENIETIFLVEPLLGRIFGYGTILVTTVGGAKFPLRYIGTPQIFHTDLQSAVAAVKMPRVPIKPPAPPADDHSRFMPKG